MFFLGDRLYGTVTAFVPGSQAASYHFTSSLAVLLLTTLAPQLQALIERSTNPSVAQAQLVTLTGENDEPAQRKLLSSNDLENLFESRAQFLSGSTSALPSRQLAPSIGEVSCVPGDECETVMLRHWALGRR